MKIFRYIVLGGIVLVVLPLGYLLLELFALSTQYESYGDKIIVHGMLSGRQEFTAYVPTKEICDQISKNAYSVPFMNGSNKQVFYVQSYCFWQIATEKKDETFCQYIKEKKHFLYDGSYYTADSCKKEIGRLK